jgi:RNA polymerase sigma-70 factor (ECF subfamily)
VTDLVPPPQMPGVLSHALHVPSTLLPPPTAPQPAAAPLDTAPVSPTSAARPPSPSLTEIYAAEVRWLWRVLWRLGVPERDLEDVAHDVFVVVHRKLQDYDPTRPLRPWLFGICFRVALDRRRKASIAREQPGTLPDHVVDSAAIDAFAVVHHRQRQALVQGALQTLPLEQRAIFVLHELEGVAVADCTAIVDAPLNTLYSRLRLARVAFARAVTRLGAGSSP